MRKKLLIIVVTLLALVALLAGFVAMQPAEFTITRSATIDAPPAEVFKHVNDLHLWQAWSPWANLDPAAKATFEGPSAGEGAIFKWSGNDEVGEGSMEIIESRPNDLIRIKLAFVRPFEDTSTSQFEFKPQGDGTAVTWRMFGRKNFISKAVCLFMDMDKMLGGQFEEGLANLDAAVKADQANDTPGADDAAESQEDPEET